MARNPSNPTLSLSSWPSFASSPPPSVAASPEHAGSHLISRASILGTGLIGGSFALALRKFVTDMHITGWDRAEVVRDAQARSALDELSPQNSLPLCKMPT